MKKIFLYAFLLFVTASSVTAQTFTIPHDTIAEMLSGDAKFYNKMKNISSAPITIAWNIQSHDFPADWDTTLGICDNVTCYSNLGDALTSGTVYTTNSIAPGVEADFYVWPDLTLSSLGTHYLQIKMTQGAYTKYSWYIFTKAPAGVVSVSKSLEDIVVYPNPAADEITILHDSKLRADKILVYSADGRLMKTTKASGMSSKIDVKDMALGIYLIRVLNESGQIAATSRFTRN